ncbi:MAG: protein-disulfide reductase DsbD family protein [Hyphomicrobiaceae bacterium]|nr:protein-disulfide reductase DsbD family protein [Hyphomicrobiaceae bacterium]
MTRIFGAAAAGLLAVVVIPLGGSPPAHAEQASDWHVDAHTGTRMRLVAGGTGAGAGHPGKLMAGIEIELPDGWKTYWRHPGDAGVPPEFTWPGGANVAAATVLYPAPHRYPDPAGSIIGYKNRVTLPVLIERADPSAPAVLTLDAAIGVCADICVPIQAQFSAGADADGPVPASVSAALRRVPGPGTDPSAVPRVVGHTATFDGKSPNIGFEVDFGPAAASGDIFIEGPRGLYIPMAERLGDPAGSRVRFRIDLTQTDDAADLKGKAVRVTMVSDAGQAEAELVLP